MNIMQKLYNKIHLNDVLALIFFLINCKLYSVFISHKILFLCISMSSLSCVQ